MALRLQQQLEDKAKEELLDIADKEWEHNSQIDVIDQYNFDQKQDTQNQNQLQMFQMNLAWQNNNRKIENKKPTNKFIRLDEGYENKMRMFYNDIFINKRNSLDLQQKKQHSKIVSQSIDLIEKTPSRDQSQIKQLLESKSQNGNEQQKQYVVLSPQDAIKYVNAKFSSQFKFKPLYKSTSQNEYIPYQKKIILEEKQKKQYQPESKELQDSQQLTNMKRKKQDKAANEAINDNSKTNMSKIFNKIYSNQQLFYLKQSAKQREIDIKNKVRIQLSKQNIPFESDLLSNGKNIEQNEHYLSQSQCQFSLPQTPLSFSNMTQNQINENKAMHLQRKTQSVQFEQQSVSQLLQQKIQLNQQKDRIFKWTHSYSSLQLGGLNDTNITYSTQLQQQLQSSIYEQARTNIENEIVKDEQNNQSSISQTSPKLQNSIIKNISYPTSAKINIQKIRKINRNSCQESVENKINKTLKCNQDDNTNDKINTGTQTFNFDIVNMSSSSSSSPSNRINYIYPKILQQPLVVKKQMDKTFSTGYDIQKQVQSNKQSQDLKQCTDNLIVNKKRGNSVMIPYSQMNKTIYESQRIQSLSNIFSSTYYPQKLKNKEKQIFNLSKKSLQFLNPDQHYENSKEIERQQQKNIFQQFQSIPSLIYKSKKQSSKKHSKLNQNSNSQPNLKQNPETPKQIFNNLVIKNLKISQNPIETIKGFKSMIESTLTQKQKQVEQHHPFIQQNVNNTYKRQLSLNKSKNYN